MSAEPTNVEPAQTTADTNLGTPYMLDGKAYRNEQGTVHKERLTM